MFRKLYYRQNQNYDLIVFSNPVSGEEFELPHLSLFPIPGQDIAHRIDVKLMFSSAPMDSSDFVVVACATLHCEFSRINKQRLAFCKVTDESWTLILDEMRFEEFVIHDWKSVCIAVSS